MSYRIDGETPYWGGKSFCDALDPPTEETMKRVEEVLKKGLTKNEDKMEEKKKMTKAGAFEWLKGKKVRCYDSLHKLWYDVQKKMLECGCVWAGLGAPPQGCVWALYVKEGVIYYLPISCADEYNNIEGVDVDYDDILSIEIVEEEKTMDAKALDEIAELGKRISGLLTVLGGGHVRITVDDVTLYGEGMNLFHSTSF